ncbi:MAG: hypothetical protein ACKV2V_25595 [Blastocatellia bacterium]
MELQKAKIGVADEKDNPVGEFDVQFNPTTLKLSLTNKVETGETLGRPAIQFIGSNSTTLHLELVFDTADEGTTENPVSVRTKTKQLEQFLRPRGTGPEENTPQRIHFVWGDLAVVGVVESLDIDFDHFAASGVPLRAKAPLTIKGQNRQLALPSAPDQRGNSPLPGFSASGGLGLGVSASVGISGGIGLSAGFSASASVGVALDGESAAEFAARVGVEPAAWRGLDIGGESSLSLSAGIAVGFDASLNASAGLGVSVGLEAGAAASIEASFGLDTKGGATAVTGVGTGGELAAGFALSSAGGVSAAIESVAQNKQQIAAQQTRQAFAAPPPAVSTGRQTQPGPPDQSRPPLKNTGLPTVSAQQSAPPAPPTPHADTRAESFGAGAPLRPQAGNAMEQRTLSLAGSAPLRGSIGQGGNGEPPFSNDPTTPPWQALPARDAGRRGAGKIQKKTRPARPCGCTGRCGH